MAFWKKKKAALHFSGAYLGDSRESLERQLNLAIHSPALPGGKVDKIDGQVFDDLGVVITVDFVGDMEKANQAAMILRESLQRYNFRLD